MKIGSNILSIRRLGVRVASGAAVVMPGMMDTILNLGLNDKVVEGLIAKTGDERFAHDNVPNALNNPC